MWGFHLLRGHLDPKQALFHDFHRKQAMYLNGNQRIDLEPERNRVSKCADGRGIYMLKSSPMPNLVFCLLSIYRQFEIYNSQLT